MSDYQLMAIGSRLDRVILYSASISLEFIGRNDLIFTLAINSDITLDGERPNDLYPLASRAFEALSMNIGGILKLVDIGKNGGNKIVIEEMSFNIGQDAASEGGDVRFIVNENGNIVADNFF